MPITLLYSSNNKEGFELEPKHYILALSEKKYLCINLTKSVQDLYDENSFLMTDIRD